MDYYLWMIHGVFMDDSNFCGKSKKKDINCPNLVWWDGWDGDAVGIGLPLPSMTDEAKATIKST